MNSLLQRDKNLSPLNNNIFDQTKVNIVLKIGVFIGMLGSLIGSSSWIILTKDILAIAIMAMTVFVLLIIFCFRLKSLQLYRLGLSILGMFGIMFLILGIVGFLIICFRIPYCNTLLERNVRMILMCNVQIFTIGCLFIIVKILALFFHLKQNVVYVVMPIICILTVWLSLVIAKVFVSIFLAQ
jgi:hypothetical protein